MHKWSCINFISYLLKSIYHPCPCRKGRWDNENVFIKEKKNVKTSPIGCMYRERGTNCTYFFLAYHLSYFCVYGAIKMRQVFSRSWRWSTCYHTCKVASVPVGNQGEEGLKIDPLYPNAFCKRRLKWGGWLTELWRTWFDWHTCIVDCDEI